MNTPHKWSKEICHAAIHGLHTIEASYANSGRWFKVDSFGQFHATEFEFRIKPERVYHPTSLSAYDLERAYAGGVKHSYSSALLRVANAAIKRYIDDTEEK